jgi:predicted amidohydrolase
MRWTTSENVAAILGAMSLASSLGARLCAFSELAITGFHRQIAREAVPATVTAAISEIAEECTRLSLAIAVGAPTFGAGTAKYNSHLLIDEQGQTRAVVPKRGLTAAEATFFEPGSSRPIAKLQGIDCSAVICREISELDLIMEDLRPGTIELIFVPGALRQDPEKSRTDPPEYVRDLQRLALATRAHVVQTNWPSALNRPEEGVEGGKAPWLRPPANSCSACLANHLALECSNSGNGTSSGTLSEAWGRARGRSSLQQSLMVVSVRPKASVIGRVRCPPSSP